MSLYGAIDLGSNSFHMVIARETGDDVHVVDRLREPVRLAAGLAEDGAIRRKVQERALRCLEQFGQRLRDLPSSRVRAVGTNTMRSVPSASEFRREAEQALGHPIEVVSGQEEARLIYIGVVNSLPLDPRRRVVIDIGGGSTEIIVGTQFEIDRAHSLSMGCVNFSEIFFPKGVITRAAFREAETATLLEMQGVRGLLLNLEWEAALGASGTIHAASELLHRNQWGGPEVTLAGLKKLRTALVGAKRTNAIDLVGLKPDRAAVLPGGVAILIGLFRGLRLDRLTTSPGALREGVLHDLIGRVHDRDVRDRAVQKFVDRYHIDVDQAARVSLTALGLHDRWSPIDEEKAKARQLLAWASLLHEVGLAVSYTGYHKHGAYLVANGDLPGFSADEQQLLGALVRSHRRKLSASVFADLSPELARLARPLCVLLRLSVLLHRSRSSRALPPLNIGGNDSRVVFTVPSGWLDEHPLTRADLEREVAHLKGIAIDLRCDTDGAGVDRPVPERS